MKSIHRILLVVVIASLLAAFGAAAGAAEVSAIFLRLEGIKGDSTDAKHKDEIQVQSFNWSARQAGGRSATGGAGKIEMQDFFILKSIDVTTPALMSACAGGKHIPRAVVSVSGAGSSDIIRYTFGDVLITSVAHSIAGGAAQEQLNFSYSSIEIENVGAAPGGGAPTKAGWDMKSNKAAARPDTSGESRAAATDADSAADAAKTAGSDAAAATERFVMAANPQLKGRLGRAVVKFPEGAKIDTSDVRFLKSGTDETVDNKYGNCEIDLLPGVYDVAISGKKVSGITIQPRQNTRVLVGVLRINADQKTNVEILDADNKTKLHNQYGSGDIGLPAGSYQVRIAGQSEPVTIKDNEVTEF